MKKAFVNIYVLILLLAIGLSLSFSIKENESNMRSSNLLYTKKDLMYKAESTVNIIAGAEGQSLIEDSVEPSYIINKYEKIYNSRIEIKPTTNELIINVALSNSGVRVNVQSNFILDKKGKLKLISKRVY